MPKAKKDTLTFTISDDPAQGYLDAKAAIAALEDLQGEKLRDGLQSMTRKAFAGAIDVPASSLYHVMVRSGLIVKGEATERRLAAKAEVEKAAAKTAKKTAAKSTKAPKSAAATKTGRVVTASVSRKKAS